MFYNKEGRRKNYIVCQPLYLLEYESLPISTPFGDSSFETYHPRTATFNPS